MKNMQRAQDIVSMLIKYGMNEVLLCPGSRNAPLVMAFQKTEGVKRWTHFEERSAAFFSLGRARCLQRPVAIVTTSGTAVAELLPATIEAYYSSTPLVLITADRPKCYRGTGAPQAIEQSTLFSPYVSKSFDLEEDVSIDLSEWDQASPIHLNVCFDEPLIDGEVETVGCHREEAEGRRGDPVSTKDCFVASAPRNDGEIQHFLANAKRPLVIVGALQPEDRQLVLDFLLRLKAPVYAEAHSGLRENILSLGEDILRHGNFDAVLRLGNVPTTRFWRDLEIKFKELPVCSISRSPFSGLARKNIFLHVPDFSFLSCQNINAYPESFSSLFEQDHMRRLRLKELYETYPRAEPTFFHTLSTMIPKKSLVYLGNSLPLREWDLAATREHREYQVLTSRGANGIDGQLSTFFGLCEKDRENWAIVGDLTALYDLTAPWMLNQLPDEMKIRLVVINNGGGMIFSRMFDDNIFQHQHVMSFEAWSQMWKLNYQCWNEMPDTLSLPKRVIIEVIPDADQTHEFWEKRSFR